VDDPGVLSRDVHPGCPDERRRHLGTITLPPGSPKYRYFGIAVFTGKHGTYKEQAVALQFPGGKRTSLFHAKIVLEGGRTQGTFAGKTLPGGIPGSGPFHC
jgi:hypothetical protein